MPTPRGSWYPLDLSIKQDEADLADNDVVVVGGIVPVAGTVKEIWVGLSILPTTGTLAVAKAGVTLLSAASTDLSSSTVYTAHTASQMTLTSSGVVKKVAAGDILTATWTLTDITVAGADDLFLCTVMIEPDVW
jgi:hypothetical protein